GGCHTVAGTPAQGKIGPNLTHIGSRQMIAANTLKNTPEDMARWIANPQEVKPGNLMRVPPLQQDVIQQLVTYLEGLK
ncbi:MAG: c-type cytochrome, partial [Chloroflexota bacterium]